MTIESFYCVVMHILPYMSLLLLLSFLKLFHSLLLQRNEDVDRAIQHYVQPQIVIVGDLYDMDLLYIVTERSIICQLPQERIGRSEIQQGTGASFKF